MLTRILMSVAFVLLPSIAQGQSRVATPTFSIDGGEYSTVVIVEVRVSTPGATIRFTQNGLDPTPADPVIASGSTIAINTSLTLKARAFMHGRRPSEVRTARFAIVGADDVSTLGPGHADAGSARSLLARPDGQVFEWVRSDTPELVSGLPRIAAVAVGAAHMLALTHDGRVYAWGANHAGQLGDGTHIRREQPVAVSGLTNVAQIAAGRSHSLAVTAEGTVWAWGSNTQGQLGHSSPNGSALPSLVASLADIVSLDAGNEHSLAVSRQGKLFAWGANRLGQLGDGSQQARSTPYLLALDNVAEVAAGASHTLAMTRDGRVYAWGSGNRGELGDGTLVSATSPVMIPDLQAVAVRAGRHFSAAVSSNGTLMTWGANDSGQLGDGTNIDRPRPVAGPDIISLSALALGDRHAIAVTSAGDVWTWGRNTPPFETISNVADWGPPFLPEELAAPVIQPPSGAYPSATTITLSSTDEHVTLHYTIDGSEPSLDSPVYAEPFVVGVATTIKVRAYSSRESIDPSDIVSASYQIDTSPPNITAHVSPVGTGDWFTTPVTVTFVCADDSGTVSCPPSVTVNTDGRSQLVSGTAIDAAGNITTTSVTLNIDLSPPSLVVNESPGGTTTSAAQLLLSGRVVDLGSGLADGLRCDGAALQVINETFECPVALQPGRNSVTLQAVDVAGHVATAGIVITRVGDATSIGISPDTRTMLVNETAPLSLHDEFGIAVAGANWSASDPAIVMLSDDDPPLVTALAAGTATIMATRNGMSAEASITVDAADVLAQGTVRWTVASTSGSGMEFPIFTHRVEPDVPEMFVVETTPARDATLRAITADGQVLWKQYSPGAPLMGDAFGGVIAGVYLDGSWDFRALVRLGGAGGVSPWRYESRGKMPRPAQAPDGTLYAVEDVAGQDANGEHIWDKHIVVIDGRTGRLLRRHPLPREISVFTAELEGHVIRESPRLVCESTRQEQTPATLGPFVGGDGRGYVLVRRLSKHKFDTCLEQHPRHRRIISNGVDLLILSADAAPVIQPIFAVDCDVAAFQSSPCDTAPQLKQLVPDGIGGMLASWDRFGSFTPSNAVLLQRVVTRRAADGTLLDRVVPNTTWIDAAGQAGISYVFAAGSWSAMDVTSWTPRWTASLGTFGPLAARPDGGAALHDGFNGVMRVVDANGQPDGAPVAFGFRQRVVQHDGNWIGVRDGKLHAVAGEFTDATRFYSIGGNAQSQLAVRRPGIGIFAKGHHVTGAVPVWMHASLRITPGDANHWTQHPRFGHYFRQFVDKDGNTRPAVDVFGNPSATIGGGPLTSNGGDTTAFCLVNSILEGTPNRHADQLTKPIYTQRLTTRASENAVIETLFDLDSTYGDFLKYECIPDDPDEFNSNSYLAGLLGAAGIEKPWFPKYFSFLFPGWSKPVPARYFGQ